MGFSTGAKATQDIFVDIINALISSEVWYNVDTTWISTGRLQDNNCRRVLAYGGTAGSGGKGNTILSASILSGVKVISVVDITNFAVGDKIVLGTGDTAEVRVISLITPGTAPAGTITVDANYNTAHTIGDIVKALNFEIYMAMDIINQSGGYNYYYGNQGWWYYGRGIRFVFSQTWDSFAHIYPSPPSSYSSFIAIESSRDNAVADLATTMVTYWLWIEDNGNGFVIMGKPEPTADANQQSFIIVVERNPAKEYSDTFTNFYLFKSGNWWPNCLYDGSWPTSIWRDRCLLRPFTFQYPDHGSWGSYTVSGNGLSFIPTPTYYAYKSNGDGKVYYVKPLIHNLAGQTTPIFQSNLFFMWSEGVGLIDGDIIAIEGQTTKYLCKALDSPDTTSRITFAIKYLT